MNRPCICNQRCNQYCNQCLFQELCTPCEKLLNNIADDQCDNFIDINNFYLDELEEDEDECKDPWKEMSWNKYIDTLYNYIEDNLP